MKRKLTILLLLSLAVAATAQVYVRNKPKVFVEATAQAFSNPNSKFLPQLKNALRENGWNVVSKKADADYTLVVTADAREYTQQVTKSRTSHAYLPTTDSVITSTTKPATTTVTNYGYGAVVEHQERTSTTKTTVSKGYVDIASKEPAEYMYFVYMEAYVTFALGNEVLYEDVLEVKEGHTKSSEEAALVASKQVISKITEILPTKIKRIR